eukprot:scaffold40404_cov32-Attheya_sp.AAC.2
MPSNVPFCMQKWHRHEVRPRKYLGLIPNGWVHGSPSIFTQEVSYQNLSEGETGVLRHGVPVIWDTGASISITPDHRNFIGHRGDHVYEHVQGMGDTRLRAEAVGWIRWYVPDDRG